MNSKDIIESKIIDLGCTSAIDYIRKLDINEEKTPAIEYYGNIINRAAYWDYIDKYRSYFHTLGIAKGEPVTICMMNSPEYEFIYAALLENGSIASTVSKSFIIADIKRQTVERGAKTLILGVEFIEDMIEHKVFDLLNRDNMEGTLLERIIFTNAFHFMPEEMQTQYNSEKYNSLIKSINLPKYIQVIMPEEMMWQIENQSRIALPSYNLIDEVATYSNTGGTTGAPKCTIHTHKAIISLLLSHDRDTYKEYNLKENSRSLLVIPISHITSQFYALLTRRASGATIVYNPFSFEAKALRDILINENIDDVTLPFGLLYAITRQPFKEGELNLNTPCCGGEPTPYLPTKDVNKRLKDANCNSLIIGTGSTEFGSGLMGSYGIDGRTNESGCFFPYATGFLIDPKTGKKINDIGRKGIFYASAPWQMLGYLNDEVATREFFNYEENGIKYGTNNDIAEIVGEHNGKPIFSMLGRATDFVLTNDNTKYFSGINMVNGKVMGTDFTNGKFLFDLRDTLLNIGGVMEAQPLILLSSPSIDEGYPVAMVTIHPSHTPADILVKIFKQSKDNNGFIPFGIHFLTHFERSLSSDKRETLSLQEIRDNYYACSETGDIYRITIPIKGCPVKELVEEVSEIKCECPPKPRAVFSTIKRTN